MKFPLSSSILIIAWGLLRIIQGQTTAFTRQRACPSDLAISGYVNVTDLNEDMAAELQRVADGGIPPDDGYDLVMCPGETFDTTGGNAIRPVIDQVRIACGGPASVDPVCLVNGSQEQLVIEDPSIPRYRLTSVTIEGLSFSNFNQQASATLTASSPTEFTCIDCTWQDFNGSDFAVNIQGTMTVRLENSIVRSTTGNNTDTVINQAIFNVRGGNLQIDGLLVQDIATRRDVIRINAGSLNVSGSALSRNSIPGNVVGIEDGATAVISDITVATNSQLNTVFLARGQGSSMLITNATIAENRLASEWSGVTAAQGSSVSLFDSLFKNNEGINFGVSSEGQSGVVSTVNIERTKFLNNIAFNGSEGGPKALAATIGDGAADPIMNILRVDFEGNSGFTADVMTLLGGQMTVNQACFAKNTNTLVAFQSKDGVPIAFSNNFIADDESPDGCGDTGFELGVETTSSTGCFYPGSTNCAVTCEGPVANSTICLSKIAFTESPSSAPSKAPSSAPSMNMAEPSGKPALASTIKPSARVTLEPNGKSSSLAPTPTLSPSPSTLGMSSTSAIPTLIFVDVGVPGSPFTMFPSRIVASNDSAIMRPDCSGKGSSRGRKFCPEQQRSKKSSKRQKGGRLSIRSKSMAKLKKSSRNQDYKRAKGNKKSGRSGTKSREKRQGVSIIVLRS